ALLDATALAQLNRKDYQARDVARRLIAGYRLFHREAGCVRCHSGPLFTDGDFHNLGIRETGQLQEELGMEVGRFPDAPIGLKERRVIGPFRKATLRKLPWTGPYVHRGRKATLQDVVEYYRGGLSALHNPLLDPLLMVGEKQAQRLELHNEDVDAL